MNRWSPRHTVLLLHYCLLVAGAQSASLGGNLANANSLPSTFWLDECPPALPKARTARADRWIRFIAKNVKVGRNRLPGQATGCPDDFSWGL